LFEKTTFISIFSAFNVSFKTLQVECFQDWYEIIVINFTHCLYHFWWNNFFEDEIWFLTKLAKQYSTNVIVNQLMENKAPLQNIYNFVKVSTWLKCFDMCVVHILANPQVYYVELNMNNFQWKLEGICTWQPKWQDCKTTNIKENPLDCGKINLGW
jgi:hypothetical protein